MRALLVFIFILNAFSQRDVIPKKQKSRMIPSKEIRFIGIDPNVYSIPKFNFNVLNVIDTLSQSYVLQINTSINYFRLSPIQYDDYSTYNYELKIVLKNDNDSIIYEKTHTETFDYNDIAYYSVLFNDHRLSFILPFYNPGNYTTTLTLKDLNSEISHSHDREVTIRNAEKEEVLISDPKFFDLPLNKLLISNSDAFTNRTDSIRIDFEAFSKNTAESYAFLLRIYRRISDNRFPEKSLIEMVKDFYHYTKRMGHYSITIPKSMFDHYELKLGLKNRIMQRVDIMPKKYISRESFERISDDTFADSISNGDYSLTKDRFSSSVTEVYLKSLNYFADNLFTFGWDTVPNTEQEMNYFSNQLFEILPDDIRDGYNDLSFIDKLNVYKNFWRAKTSENNQYLGYIEAIRFKDKVEFANANFFNFHMDSNMGVVRKEPFFLNGWRSEKGILYLKYGLPESIYGENYINEDGSLKWLFDLPVQQWSYNNNRIYVFIGNERVIRN